MRRLRHHPSFVFPATGEVFGTDVTQGVRARRGERLFRLPWYWHEREPVEREQETRICVIWVLR
jgi:hypothetical protein